LKKKSNVAAVTEGVLARLELQTRKKVKAVQTDRGGEYVNEEMTTLLSKRRSRTEKQLDIRLNRTDQQSS
jgi:hypothetical protein